MNQLDTKFGEFGGMYVPELLIPALDQLEKAFLDAKEDPSFNEEFLSKASSTGALPETVDRHLNNKRVNRVLFDCQVGDAKGGTGESFDWQLLSGIEAKHKLVLAGGIDADNAADAIATGCGVIDVNSGVETAPGTKSADKLKSLFAACRRY